jgi:hypothetical protein
MLSYLQRKIDFLKKGKNCLDDEYRLITTLEKDDLMYDVSEVLDSF